MEGDNCSVLHHHSHQHSASSFWKCCTALFWTSAVIMAVSAWALGGVWTSRWYGIAGQAGLRRPAVEARSKRRQEVFKHPASHRLWAHLLGDGIEEGRGLAATICTGRWRQRRWQWIATGSLHGSNRGSESLPRRQMRRVCCLGHPSAAQGATVVGCKCLHRLHAA